MPNALLPYEYERSKSILLPTRCDKFEMQSLIIGQVVFPTTGFEKLKPYKEVSQGLYPDYSMPLGARSGI